MNPFLGAVVAKKLRASREMKAVRSFFLRGEGEATDDSTMPTVDFEYTPTPVPLYYFTDSFGHQAEDSLLSMTVLLLADG